MAQTRKGRPIVRTSIEFPEKLWRAAKVRALDERVRFREIVIRALEDYLGKK